MFEAPKRVNNLFVLHIWNGTLKIVKFEICVWIEAFGTIKFEIKIIFLCNKLKIRFTISK